MKLVDIFEMLLFKFKILCLVCIELESVQQKQVIKLIKLWVFLHERDKIDMLADSETPRANDRIHCLQLEKPLYIVEVKWYSRLRMIYNERIGGYKRDTTLHQAKSKAFVLSMLSSLSDLLSSESFFIKYMGHCLYSVDVFIFFSFVKIFVDQQILRIDGDNLRN